MPPPKSLITVEEYEEGFFLAVRSVHGEHGVEEVPAGVTALFEATKNQVKRVREAGKALQHSVNESSELFLSELLKAQDLCHYRSKEDVTFLYQSALNQSRGYEQQFLQASMELERMRVLHD